jgi:hypothetical protein
MLSKRLNGAALGAAVAIGVGLSALPAHAQYVVTLTRVADPSQPLGFDVDASGGGTIDTTGLGLSLFGGSHHLV